MKDVLKNYDFTITNKISLHFGEESLWYLIPTIGFQKLDWRLITGQNHTTYLFAIKWLKVSIGIVIKINKL
jgi:hypothetical protein